MKWRFHLGVWIATFFLLTGCGGRKLAKSTEPRPVHSPVASPDSPSDLAQVESKQNGSANQKMIVTPDTSASPAKVSLVNLGAKFVVLTFPIGHLPVENEHLSIYRRGLKVGEVKVTGPQKDDNVVADLIAGEAQIGDEVR